MVYTKSVVSIYIQPIVECYVPDRQASYIIIDKRLVFCVWDRLKMDKHTYYR